MYHRTSCSDGVSRHWDAEVDSLGLNSWEDELQTLGSCFSLVTSSSNTVLHVYMYNHRPGLIQGMDRQTNHPTHHFTMRRSI